MPKSTDVVVQAYSIHQRPSLKSTLSSTTIKSKSNPKVSNNNVVISRRSAFLIPTTAAIITMITSSSSTLPAAEALDIDSFIQKELDDTSTTCNEKTDKKCKPKLSTDEALCRFGQPSKSTGDACLRAGLSTKRPSGVDAYGSIDRGNFVKCKPNYVEDPQNPGFLINRWICQ
jgi:hypothetical protein